LVQLILAYLEKQKIDLYHICAKAYALLTLPIKKIKIYKATICTYNKFALYLLCYNVLIDTGAIKC